MITFRNTLLSHLPADIIERLALVPVTFELARDLEMTGQTIKHLFFVEEGVASMTTSFEDGSQVEVTLLALSP